MFEKMHLYALACGMTVVLVQPCMGANHVTGVSGTVSTSPARPGPQRIGEPGSAPYRGATVKLRDAQGRVVAHETTDARGYFTVAVPPGTYQVRVDARPAIFPRCKTVEAVVHLDQITQVAILCDSGMR